MNEIIKSVYSFLKDPLTEKLVKRHIPNVKFRKGLDTAVRIVEVLVITLPLIEAVRASVQDVVKSSKDKGTSRSGGRSSGSSGSRSLPRSAASVH